MSMIDERYCKLHVGDTIVLDASNFITMPQAVAIVVVIKGDI